MKEIVSFCIVVLFIYTAQTRTFNLDTPVPAAKLNASQNLKVIEGFQGADNLLICDFTDLAIYQPPPPVLPPNNSTTWICCNPWMAKNLDVSTYRNGDPIPKVTNNAAWAALTTGAYCYYNNDSTTYAAIYGKLYNWYAVNDPRGLAPQGWHVASNFEWATLSKCLGGNDLSGGPVKETGTTHWTTPNTGATNFTNFTAVPSGWRVNNTGTFGLIGTFSFWWTASIYGSTNAWTAYVTYDNSAFQSDVLPKVDGAAVRCVKD